MVVLQFAWGSGATNTHLPHNHYENSVCYPGDPSYDIDVNLQHLSSSAAYLAEGIVPQQDIAQVAPVSPRVLGLRSTSGLQA